MVQPNTQVVPIGSGATYMLSISIRVGFGTISLKSDSLKSEAIALALKENGVKSKDTLPIFEAIKDGKKFSLTTAGTALGTMLDRLQNRYMICSGSKRWWFVAEGDMDAIRKGLEEMESERVRLLSQLQALYDQARSLFYARINNILAAANRQDEFESYARKFPVWSEIQEEFRIELDGPIKIPALSELAKQEPDMQRWLRNVHDQMQRDLPKLIDDLCSTASVFLGRLEQVDPQKLNNTQANQLSKASDRIESLNKLYDSICLDTTFDSPVRSLIRVCSATKIYYAKNPALTQDALISYLCHKREELKDSELLCGAGIGHRALYEWVHGASREQRIKDLVQELELFKQGMSNLSDEEHSSQLQALKTKAESQALLMNHAYCNLLAMLNKLETTPAYSNANVEQSQLELAAIAPSTTDLNTDNQMLEAGF